MSAEQNGSAAAEAAGAVGDGVKKGLGTGGKWLLGSLAAGTVVFSTVVMTSGNNAKQVALADNGVVAEEQAIVPGSKSGSGGSQPKRPSGGGQQPSGSSGLGGGTVEDRIAVQEMNMQALRNDIAEAQREQIAVINGILQKVEEVAQQKQEQSAAPKVDLPQLMRSSRPNERFTGEYQTKVDYFKSNRGNGWAMSDGELKALVESHIGPPPSLVLSQYAEGARPEATDVPLVIKPYEYMLPAGSRIFAVTEGPVNSDHPGFFTSRIIRPEILRNAHLICSQGGQQNLRIPVQVVKIIFKDKEYTLSGQIEMGFPGVTGKVNRHYGSRAVPIVTNAAITGGFVAWAAQNRGSDRVDTRDMVTAEVVGQTVPQIQGEIAKFAVDRPPTVSVASGTQFTILLTSALTVSY